MMCAEKLYATVDGEKVPLYQMVRQEPGWATARIRVAEQHEARIAELEAENAELKLRLAKRSVKQ